MNSKICSSHRFAMLSVFCFLAVILGGCEEKITYRIYNEPTPIFKAIGNQSELWMFFEFRRVICLPSDPRDEFPVFDTPQCKQIKTIQDVLIVNQNGDEERVTIENGISYSLANIFSMPDGMYLYEGESMSWEKSLFKWSGNRFELLPKTEAEKFTLLGQPLNWNSIDLYVEQSEWKKLSPYLKEKNDDTFRSKFVWNNENINVLVEENEVGIHVSIKNDSGTFEHGFTRGRDLEVIESADPGMMHRLTRQHVELEQNGHPKE